MFLVFFSFCSFKGSISTFAAVIRGGRQGAVYSAVMCNSHEKEIITRILKCLLSAWMNRMNKRVELS